MLHSTRDGYLFSLQRHPTQGGRSQWIRTVVLFNVDAGRPELPGLHLGHGHWVSSVVEQVQVATAACRHVLRVHSRRDARPAPASEALDDRVVDLLFFLSTLNLR